MKLVSPLNFSYGQIQGKSHYTGHIYTSQTVILNVKIQIRLSFSIYY